MENEISSSSYKKDEKKTLAEVIISQIDVCRKELSKEILPSYDGQKVIEGQVVNWKFPDQSITNQKSVETLNGLLRYYFDDTFKENFKIIFKTRKEAYERYHKNYLEKETNETVKHRSEKTGLINNITSTGTYFLNALKRYREGLVREEFEQLVLLFKRRNELIGKKTAKYE